MRGSSVGLARRNRRLRISTGSRLPAHRSASAASANSDFGEGQGRGFQFEPSVPPDRSRRSTSGLNLYENDEIVERVDERQPTHLLRRDLGSVQVLLPDGASEASVR